MNNSYTLPLIDTVSGGWEIDKILPLDAFVYSSFLRSIFSKDIESSSVIKMMLLNENATFNPSDTNISALDSYEINDADYSQGGNICNMTLVTEGGLCTFLFNVDKWQNSTLSFWKSVIYNSVSGDLILFIDFLENKNVFSNDFELSGNVDIRI